MKKCDHIEANEDPIDIMIPYDGESELREYFGIYKED